MRGAVPLVAVLLAGALPASAEDSLLDHPGSAWYWLSGQVNAVFQAHPAFPAAYDGPQSLPRHAEGATSLVATLYAGAAIGRSFEIVLDLESAGGRGIGDAQGLAGYTDLDVVRNPDLGAAPYVARAFVRWTLPLAVDTVEVERSPLSLRSRLPARRVELLAGKFSLDDFLDQNAVGSDSHLQFLNWTVDDDGAWDYAADTRGYTYGAMASYVGRGVELRFVEAMMPKVANGLVLDWALGHSRGENLELTIRPRRVGARASAIRLLAFVNHAHMGDYREAVASYLDGRTSAPDVAATRRKGAVKYGFGVNLEREISSVARGFLRWGWNEGRHESFAYTEVDDTLALGADLRGDSWGRSGDRVGVAVVSNGISGDHRRYLELGGQGFLLGDGALDYGREEILETYYTARLARGVYSSFDLQLVRHPGYNRDRGPVVVASVRLHLEI